MATETFVINVQTRGTVRAARSVRQIGAAASSTRKALALMRNALVAIAALQVFTNLTRSLVEFSDQMLIAKAVTQATEAEFRILKQTAQDLGATTRFTAAEAAEGMAFLGRAGFNVNEIIQAIPATLDLAAAAQLDLGRAADIASNLMTSFGLTTADTTNVIDTLVATANSANTNVQQLADGLKLVAPIASQAGVSLQQASSIMAVLGNSGIQASLAGTGFRRVITDLLSPVGNLKKGLEFLNVPLEDVNPLTNDFVDILKTLKDAGAGAANASFLFGKRGGFVAAALLRAIPELERYEAAMEDVEGVSRRAAEEAERGIGGALRLVRSAFQAIIIAIGESGFEDFANVTLRNFAEALRNVAANVEGLKNAFKFLIGLGVAKFFLSVTLAAVRLTTTLVATTAATWAQARAQMGAAATARVWGAALLRIPFVAAAAGLIALTTAAIAYGDEIRVAGSETVLLGDVFDELGSLIQDTLLDALDSLGFSFENFGDIADTVLPRAAAAVRDLVSVFGGLRRAVPAIIDTIKLRFLELTGIVAGGLILMQQGINSISPVDVFDTRSQEIQFRALESRIDKLRESLNTDGVGTSFLAGFFDTQERIAQRAQDRLDAARDRVLANLVTRVDTARRNPPRAAPENVPGVTIDTGDAADDAADALARLQDQLDSLVGSVFPAVAATNALADAQELISEAVAAGAVLRVDEAELLKRVRREQLGLGPVIEQVAEQQRVYNKALQDGIISLREFEGLTRQNRLNFLEGQTDSASGIERAFLKIQEQASDSAAFTEMVFTDAFKALEDNFVSFIQEGTFELDSFFQNLSEQLLRLAAQQAIAGATSSIGGLFGSGLSGGTGAGPTGGGAASSGFGGIIAGALFGAANGAQFTVGAQSSLSSLPGIDNRLIAFKARDGEEVTVTPRAEGGGGSAGGPINIVQNIQTKDADSFARSEGQNAARAAAVLQRARARR